MYDNLFSKDVGSFFRSPVREIFKKVDLNSIYSFAGGYPSAETFPMEAIRETMSEVIDKYKGKAFQYGATQGVTELREAIAQRYDVSVERVQITSSSQQGIDVCTRILTDPGDVILTSSPSYLGALQSFCSYRADIRGVSHHEDLAVYRSSYESTIEGVLSEGKKVKFLYMIPDFQNPSGESLTLEERRMLVELAKKYGMADDVVHAIAAHHDDIEPTTREAIIVKICDAMSAARPGARNISAENFAERMRDLENIATSFTGIDKAYAISAGREIRVIVEPKTIDDLSALKLARDIANKIEATISYPGIIKVNVIRETRAVEYAK